MIDTEFEARIREFLRKELEDKIMQVTNGGLVPSDYHSRCGYIKALREVTEVCDDIARKIYGRS